MGKPKLILADTDYGYLESLEIQLIEMLKDQMELIVITEAEYFGEYFAVQREADVLVISENLYTETIQRHDIQKIIVLNERGRSDLSQPECIWMDKFSNIKNIANEAVYGLQFGENERRKKDGTTVVTVCSAAGGSGKTTIAMGISRCLAAHHRRVLYLSTESVQSFPYYLKEKISLDTSVYRLLRDEKRDHYADIRPYVRSEEFFFIPPFSSSLDSVQIPFRMYQKLVEDVKKSQEYDFIVIDTDTALRSEVAKLMSLSDVVEVVVKQDAFTMEKTNYLLQNIDCSNQEKYIFVCNCYEEDAENAIEDVLPENCKVSAYIERMEGHVTLEEVGQREGIQGLTYMLM